MISNYFQRKNIGPETFNKLQGFLKHAYMQVYPDQTNVTIDMINKYVKGSFSKVCMQKDASDDAWEFANLKIRLLNFWNYNYCNQNIVDISGALFTF